jgi:hypothetical protein
VSESLTYADALKILGDRQSRLVGFFDGVVSAGLTAWSATSWWTGTDPSIPLNLFDLKDEIVRFGHEAVRRLGERRSGLSRFDRSQRLAAAHAVLVVSSYFDALGQADLPIPPQRLALTANDKVGQATGDVPSKGPKGYAGLVEGLLSDRLPLPEPHLPYARTREAIGSLYELMSRRLATFVRGVNDWDRLASRERTRMLDAIMRVPVQALKTYDETFQRLVTDNREFEVWAGLNEAHALGAGLSEVGRLLTEMAARRPGDRPLTHLIRGYRAALADPIVATGRAPEWVALPTLGEAYVSPRCKAAEVRPGDTPSAQDWWEDQVLLPHAERFLAGYLTSPRAAHAPLVVLGEPGSGKSKLTEVLAARLPDGDFLPIRVELRDVDADAPIVEQIEQTIYRQAGERAGFHDLVEAAGGALPVVMLDGFDELLQAVGVNRYDYLEQVRDFQRRQLAIGYPIAVVVTSRTVVADRVRYPVGTIALQLQPFGDDQVRHWLEVWRHHNTALLATRGLRPLTAEAALSHRELARQPLLLLMLAIFDATGNALQGGDTSLGQAELYEALLMDFAFREIRKYPENRALTLSAQRKVAEAELERLAVVALAMFARGRQSVTDEELDRDLPILLPTKNGTVHDGPGEDDYANTNDASLSMAQRATGRFFFIHRSQAHAQGRWTRTYEFLHTTFGEFLVAWLTTRALAALVAAGGAHDRPPAGSATGEPLDDGFLYSVLSFACVAERAPIADSLAEIMRGLPDAARQRHRALLLGLLDRALYPNPGRSYAAYEPARHPLTRRLAAYSANLTVLLVLLDTEGTTAGAMFGAAGAGPAAAVQRWIDHSYLWKAQLPASEWNGLVHTVRVRVVRDGASIDVRLSREDGSPASVLDSFAISPPGTQVEPTDYDVLVSHGSAESYDYRVPATTELGFLIRKMAFLPNWRMGMLLLQAVPYFRIMGDRIRWHQGGDNSILPAYLLSHLDYARDTPTWKRADLYAPCLEAMTSFPELESQVLLRLRDDARTLPVATTVDLLRQAGSIPPSAAYLEVINDLWSRHPGGGARAGIGGRGLIVALVKGIEQRWPDADLSRLAPDLRAAASARRRATTTT